MNKKLFKYIILFVILFTNLKIFSQKENYIWYFADSCGIDFNFNPPKVLLDGVSISYELASTISDKNGNLLFYIDRLNRVPDSWIPDCFYGRLVNKNHQTLKNSDSIMIFTSSTQGALILPKPGSKNIYYFFHQAMRLYPTMGDPFVFNEDQAHIYSIVDMSLNNGMGEITSKNNVLINKQLTEKMIAIRHGNGRDWWLILHGTNFMFYKVLLTPNGIDSIFTQNIGPDYDTVGYGYYDLGQMASSLDGSKIAMVSYKGNIDIFNFDRCSGEIYNWIQIAQQVQEGYYGCAFSPDHNYLYVANELYPYRLYQYDLNAVDIPSSKTTIAQGNYDGYFAQMQIAPNYKIYISSYESEYLHIIENPNMQGLSCNYKDSAFHLNGKKSNCGLPNTPNFKLGSLLGSACDTIPIVQPEEKPETIYIPNIFSPNNDGQNDVLYVYGDEIKSMILVIYNRWGEKVFETSSITLGWDGFYKGKPCQLGVYMYYFDAELKSGEKFTKRGNISLVR